MINLGNIRTRDCENTEPLADTRCDDPAFALYNSALCPPRPTLMIKPSFAVACVLGSVQFKAFLVTNGEEEDVTSETIFSSNSLDLAVVGATSGNATGTGAGTAYITATYESMTATAEFVVLAGTDCCATQNVAFLVMADVTRSMQSPFGSGYATRLDAARHAITQLVTKINVPKDEIGLMEFTAETDSVLAAITTTKATVQTAVDDDLNQTSELTAFYDALTTAFATLNAATADRKVLVIVSDGENEDPLEKAATKDPLLLANDFKNAGGIIICVGVRASASVSGFAFLSALSTGGFFINLLPATFTEGLDYFTGLLGYLCAGDCTPLGDEMVATGELNYSSFLYWDVTLGNVDLLGNGLFDVLPGNGLYVNLAGTSAPHNGLMTSKMLYSVTAGHEYRLTLDLAGNQVHEDSGANITVSVIGSGGAVLLQHVVISDFESDFHAYSFAFTAPATDNVYITIQETDAGATPDVPVTPPTTVYAGATVTIMGTGSPEGVIAAVPGQFYWDSAADALWIKDTGTGNTGWLQLIG